MFGYLIAAARHVVNTLYPAYVQEDENHVPHSLPLAIEYTRETVTTVQNIRFRTHTSSLGDIFQLQLYDGPNQITADVHFQRAIYNNVDDVIVILATLAPPASLRRGHTKLFRYFAYEHYAMLSMGSQE
ncbi:hypothetical protein PUNSTDRAFT_134313 [Punctularia strigosozonata HHB-11173 SS5]|uniref:uncharacterized protein n=1 Tax=Punctularia strigosozonata (strain HHB-11173) TaxID=741275 RepID=UPI00044174B9|nr:uncharacterized protein PUNSTDRAFT_134313 [Punctularia strigosozonata HHB-11173 SS5]EIN09149.1 hypothetical protein PUNSTDRAFT_134313 [Punctularia strigosozonata HHB-11173 SS5]